MLSASRSDAQGTGGAGGAEGAAEGGAMAHAQQLSHAHMRLNLVHKTEIMSGSGAH